MIKANHDGVLPEVPRLIRQQEMTMTTVREVRPSAVEVKQYISKI
jgi:hypothetical protein